MKSKRTVLFSVIIILAGVFGFAIYAHQKNDNHRTGFSGEWKSAASISMGGNIVCCYNDGDRMLSQTMKIVEQADFLTIEASSSLSGTAPVTSLEKLAFDGKATEINHGPDRGKKSTVKLSADGQTMTVNSIVYVQPQLIVNVTEVWKLSDDGKSISVQAGAKSNSFSAGRTWTTIFDKVL